MKQSLYRAGSGLVMALGLVSGATAADYSSYSNEEMMQMRSRVREMSPQEHEAFRSEMRNRQQSMSPEERSRFREQNSLSGQGARYGQGGSGGQGYRYGQGSGNGQGYRYGQGNGSGQGHRYGQGGGGRGR
ncbi:MAG TPA: DUF1104 domain-containing protein [Gammaproteobacteria bacterium]|nr:DUF1104 domain-containing protein [Gammaproteobacteria bacterium]